MIFLKKRDLYLNKLIALKDKSLIKVITGVRRCGKSSLLSLYEDYLKSVGVTPQSIIRMDFESLEFDDIKDYKRLNEYITSKIEESSMTYILLDEVQSVFEWERAINSLRLNKNLDIYITGSNGRLLASELSTLLAGRYIEIHMLPLSFKEFLYFNDIMDDKMALQSGNYSNLNERFNTYIEFGGLPGLTELWNQKTMIEPYIEGIYNTIIMKDVIKRNEVRDPALLENVIRFMAGNIGNPISSKKISNYLTSSGRKTSSETIDNYLRMFESAYVLYRAGRYDLKGKQNLKTQGKYYIIDLGIRNELVGRRGQDYGATLENIVYFELLRRGFTVKVGHLSGHEVDFVATKSEQIIYFQVTATMLAEETRNRELRPLQAINDNY